MIGGFLDELLDKYRPELKPDAGELQICFVMVKIRGMNEDGVLVEKENEYNIAIVALSGDDRILRVLATIPLSDALSTILKNLPNV